MNAIPLYVVSFLGGILGARLYPNNLIKCLSFTGVVWIVAASVWLAYVS